MELSVFRGVSGLSCTRGGNEGCVPTTSFVLFHFPDFPDLASEFKTLRIVLLILTIVSLHHGGWFMGLVSWPIDEVEVSFVATT